jgi:transposase
MIQALIAGETDPANLAALVDRRIKASPQQLREALRGRVTDHHRFLLQLHLQYIEFADSAIQDIDRNVAALITRMDQEVEAGQTRATFQSLILFLMTIPRHRCAISADHRVGHRPRHEPVPDRATSPVLGGVVSAQR